MLEPLARLQLLREEISAIADAFLASDMPAQTEEVSATFIRRLRAIRRLRFQYFDEGLFADPVWDMLIDLSLARREGRNISISSLCIAAGVPPTTALRCIKSLTERGMLRREADQKDARRTFIRMSDETAEALDDCLLAMARC